jgi:hypothetical protein
MEGDRGKRQNDDREHLALTGKSNTLDSIGLNLEALNIFFVERFGTAADNEIIKMFALERIKQANRMSIFVKERDQVINDISKSIPVACFVLVCVCRLIFADRGLVQVLRSPLGEMPDENQV